MKATVNTHTVLIILSAQMFGLVANAHISSQASEETPPNVLWITSEDNSPLLGCYGDAFATTPTLDSLASGGFLYSHAYANAPVCAPARNTIITGVYANSAGQQHMRSEYNTSSEVVPFPALLKQAGYYCTNNSKEDYNAADIHGDIWSESSPIAHYKNRAKGQPFFAVFNHTVTHESSIHKPVSVDTLRHSPSRVTLPPYHPDTPEIREDWAHYYDQITRMDQQVSAILTELKDRGLLENTIVIYFSDHGGVLARSKRYVYETGTRVPLIISIPKQFKNLWPETKVGSTVDRLVSFIDLAPTMLSLANVKIPSFMQGAAFLGTAKTPDPPYTFMLRGRMDERPDMSRAVRDSTYRYIRNYMPYRIYGQYLNYLWRAKSTRSWEREYQEGRCNETQSKFWEKKPFEELYNTTQDPWEVRNLAKDPAYQSVLERMRTANEDWMERIFDVGLIPETSYATIQKRESLYNYVRSDQVDIEALLNASSIGVSGRWNNQEVSRLLRSVSPNERYWGVVGLLSRVEKAKSFLSDLKHLLYDGSLAVATGACELLYDLGEKELATQRLIALLKQGDEIDRVYVLNTIDYLNLEDPRVQDAVKTVLRKVADLPGKHYDRRMALWLVEKWRGDEMK